MGARQSYNGKAPRNSFHPTFKLTFNRVFLAHTFKDGLPSMHVADYFLFYSLNVGSNGHGPDHYGKPSRLRTH